MACRECVEAGAELKDVFLGCVPFVIMELIIVGLLIAFPQISLFAVSD
jgi:TRAP-type mannitol/chloroaromatic compound transport system permease large subunit